MLITKGNNSIEIPLSVFDIKAGDFIDYKRAIKKYELEAKAKLNKNSFTHDVSTIIDAVSFICKGDLHLLPFSVEGINEVEIIYTSNTPFDELSFLGLFSHIQNICASYEVDERIKQSKVYSFFYKDEAYRLDASRLMTLNAIEALEIERITDALAKKDGDTEGDKEYTKLIRWCSIFCLKDGEILPINQRERDRFLEERSEHFKDLTLNITEDVSFFLSTFIIDYLKTQNINFSLTDYPMTQLLTKQPIVTES